MFWLLPRGRINETIKYGKDLPWLTYAYPYNHRKKNSMKCCLALFHYANLIHKGNSANTYSSMTIYKRKLLEMWINSVLLLSS